MATLLGVLALLTVIGALVAHVMLVRALSRRTSRGRLVLAAVFPPLAMLDGFAGRARREAGILGGVVLLHALLVVVVASMR